MDMNQRENLDAILRQSAFPADAGVDEQRRLLRELLSAQPLPADVTVTEAVLGGVPTAEVTVDGIEPRHVVLYFHGGVYVMGDAFLAAELASQVGRRTEAKVISVDYADLTLAGTTIDTKREVDPLLSREALQARVPDYTAGQDVALGLISPVFADLSGLPPLSLQVGSHEVLLDDAVRLARQAGAADVAVTLDITPGVPHVFQAYHSILDEGAAALDRGGRFLSAHLAGAERVAA
jgi:acetyl esterase/lipase